MIELNYNTFWILRVIIGIASHYILLVNLSKMKMHQSISIKIKTNSVGLFPLILSYQMNSYIQRTVRKWTYLVAADSNRMATGLHGDKFRIISFRLCFISQLHFLLLAELLMTKVTVYQSSCADSAPHLIDHLPWTRVYIYIYVKRSHRIERKALERNRGVMK